MISHSDQRPRVFEPMGNGYIAYHFDIVEETVPATEETEEKTQYSYHEVVIKESDGRDDLTRETIREFCSPETELKMINESHTPTKYAPTQEYKDYLVERARRVDMVKSDWSHRYEEV